MLQYLFPLTYLGSPLLAELSKYCVLGGGGKRRALALYHSEKIKILNIFSLISSSRKRTHNLSRLQSHACATGPQPAFNDT